MFSSSAADDFRARRYIGAFLFLFVFTLPLHFHSGAENSRICQECSCYCGGRTQLGLAPSAEILAPIRAAVVLVTRITKAPAIVIAESESARAPPYSF